jgi:hypothetical protein
MSYGMPWAGAHAGSTQLSWIILLTGGIYVTWSGMHTGELSWVMVHAHGTWWIKKHSGGVPWVLWSEDGIPRIWMQMGQVPWEGSDMGEMTQLVECESIYRLGKLF